MNLSPIRRARTFMRPARSMRVRPRLEPLEGRRLLSVILHESEPNNSMKSADPVDRRLDELVTVKGSIDALGDRDWFAVPLQQGDVVGVALKGKGQLDTKLRLVNADRELMVGNDDAFEYGKDALPPDSPIYLRTGKDTDSEIYYVIPRAGTYFLKVTASGQSSQGKYEMDLVVTRPAMEKQAVGARQVLFLDFDGATIDLKQGYSGIVVKGKLEVSPLSDALPEWGLSSADEDAVIDAILAVVNQKLSAEIRSRGLNGDYASTGVPGQFDIEIRNSRDDADEFGVDPLVSRVVVGLVNNPTLEADSLGQARYIDAGNLMTNDDAFATVDWVENVLNNFPIAPPATVFDAIGVGVGYLIAHEAGHMFGCWHTDTSWPDDPFAGPNDLMDTANFGLLGPDLVFGTADDIDYSFGVDDFWKGENLRGINDTLNTIAFGLSTGTGTCGRTERHAVKVDPRGQADHSSRQVSLSGVLEDAPDRILTRPHRKTAYRQDAQVRPQGYTVSSQYPGVRRRSRQ